MDQPTTGSPGTDPSPPAAPGPPGPPGPPTWTPYDPYAWSPPAPSPAWMELPPDRPPRWGMGDIVAGLALWLLGSIVFAVPGIVASDGSGQIEGVWAVVALVGSWTGMVGWLLYASRRKGVGTLARDFGFRFRWIDPVIGFGAGFATLIVTGIASQVISALAGEPAADNTEAIFGGQEGSSIGLVLLAIGAAIGAPIIEELFFRGLALRAIERRFGPVIGVIGSSAVFGLLHFQPGSWVQMVTLVAVIGGYAVVFSILTRFFRRLGPAVFAHMTINGIGVALLVYTSLRI